MKFTVEVLLKGHDVVVDEVIELDAPEPHEWTDDHVHEILRLTLASFDRVQNPDAEVREVALRGLSWIVTPVDKGVAIAIEIPSGAVVAGPFLADVDPLTAAIDRVMAKSRQDVETVH
tara:strand:- start:6529 stop:6882 length:354 start_codon:yes stop_codon:yes gene_type:complete